MKKYPAPLSMTTWMNFIGGAQSAVIAVTMQHKPEAWQFTVSIQLWSTIYAVSKVMSGFQIYKYNLKLLYNSDSYLIMPGSGVLGHNNLRFTMVQSTKRASFCDHV